MEKEEQHKQNVALTRIKAVVVSLSLILLCSLFIKLSLHGFTYGLSWLVLPALFLGYLLAYSTISVLVAERRESNSELVNPKVLYDIFAIALGIALTFLTYNFHEYLSGVKLT